MFGRRYPIRRVDPHPDVLHEPSVGKVKVSSERDDGVPANETPKQAMDRAVKDVRDEREERRKAIAGDVPHYVKRTGQAALYGFAVIGFAAVATLGQELFEEAHDGVREVSVPIPDQVWEDVLNGNGNGSQAAFYEAVGKEVDDLMVQSGECITLTITNQEGEIIGEIHHAPERDINQSPADVCPEPEA